MTQPRVANRLQAETSPYLLHHAGNPVDWFPWGTEALERARREDRPILLSVGYAACHWCHVMERECFEDEDVARLMNQHFVCIKVDREERPDIDDIYMAATVALQGSGGWPMTVFLTPDQAPFFAGTYFPKLSTGSQVGFAPLLVRISELWKGDRRRLLEQAHELTRHLVDLSRPLTPVAVSPRATEGAIEALRSSFDARFGGFGVAPKFPPCAQLSLLLRRYQAQPEPSLIEMVTRTLDGMKNGGMRDHLGGGFARYSTDERWLVPHFEKMLYDNAQLASVYLEASQLTGSGEYARVAWETLDYVCRELQSPQGGYYSSTDADSEGEEGKFFVFSPEQVHEVLGEPLARAFCAYYDVTPQGNWDGKSVLHTPQSIAEVARQLGLSVERLGQLLGEARARMFEFRARRTAPALDDKVVTSWNGLMIGAMAEGARVLREARFADSARRAARFALAELERPDGGLYRTFRLGRAQLPAYLEDYALLADGLVSLYECGHACLSPSEPHEFLMAAQSVAARMVRDFAATDGAFYATAHDHEQLLVRCRDGHDGALPSANAVAARALWRLGRHLDRSDWLEAATRALQAYGSIMERSPRAFTTALSLAEQMRAAPLEVVLSGERGDPELERIAEALSRVYAPGVVRATAFHDREGDTPLTRGKGLSPPGAAAYVCRDRECLAPATEPEQAEQALRRAISGAA